MFYTFDMLKEGNPQVLMLYSEGYKIWDDIFRNFNGTTTQLANLLGSEQLKFEMMTNRLGVFDRWTSHEIMVFTGLTYYLNRYKESKPQNAAFVAEAFQLSFCSIEVKGLAERVGKLLYLSKYYDKLS